MDNDSIKEDKLNDEDIKLNWEDDKGVEVNIIKDKESDKSLKDD
jgi:hypothetical protein